jgi:hypothetical protein
MDFKSEAGKGVACDLKITMFFFLKEEKIYIQLCNSFPLP